MKEIIRQNIAYIYNGLYIIEIFLLGIPLFFYPSFFIKLLSGTIMFLSTIWLYQTTKRIFYFEDTLNYYSETYHLTPVSLALITGYDITDFTYNNQLQKNCTMFTKMPFKLSVYDDILNSLETKFGKIPS
ncbi:hypothetical protein CBF37_03425 [Vagococcus vulneris]|uniref:Uncharacterized protein n=2 Tax=Vagococcus vulneris TaxID=1977869 RepID=A0A430A0B7_9ENTE|nr:hypothetical protein CBF37_03425 [Vagococcus vulneris]